MELLMKSYRKIFHIIMSKTMFRRVYTINCSVYACVFILWKKKCKKLVTIYATIGGNG